VIVEMWQGEQVIGRCPDPVCRKEHRADTADGLKQKIRLHLRQFHRVTEEPRWRGP